MAKALKNKVALVSDKKGELARDSRTSKQSLYSQPLLKWPGGKRWLAPKLRELISMKLQKIYFEPFLGAGSVFLSTGPERSVLSDINRELIDCLQTIRDDPETVLRAIWRYSNTSACYYRVRKSNPRTAVGAAARFIYLNRTCWGGVHRLNREGKFNTPFGDSGRTICRRDHLIAYAQSLQGAELKCCDFQKTMDLACAGDVIYADPPYTTHDENRSFIRYNEHLFSWVDQIRLAQVGKAAADRGAFVIISNLWNDEIKSLYTGWWVVQVNRATCVSRKSTGRRSVAEAILFSSKPKCVSDWMLTRL